MVRKTLPNLFDPEIEKKTLSEICGTCEVKFAVRNEFNKYIAIQNLIIVFVSFYILRKKRLVPNDKKTMAVFYIF